MKTEALRKLHEQKHEAWLLRKCEERNEQKTEDLMEAKLQQEMQQQGDDDEE